MNGLGMLGMNRSLGGKNNGEDSVRNKSRQFMRSKSRQLMGQSNFKRAVLDMSGRLIRTGPLACLVLLAMRAGGIAEAAETNYLSAAPELIQSSTQGVDM